MSPYGVFGLLQQQKGQIDIGMLTSLCFCLSEGGLF